jgi:sugar phosphate isomerase/epimerase
MLAAARRQEVEPDRISFIDTVRWLLAAAPGETMPILVVNPRRKGRHEPGAIKDIQDIHVATSHGVRSRTSAPMAAALYGRMIANAIAPTIRAMIRLAFSTNAFKKHSLFQAIEAIAAAGYSGVELMADVPHAYPPNFDAQQRQAVSEQLRLLKLSVSNINAFTLFAMGDTYHPSWLEEEERLREVRINHTLRCIELAAEFGSKTVSLQPGGPMIGTKITRAEAGQRFAEGLRRVIRAAQRNGVTLAIEPEPGLFIETSAEYLDFKREFFNDEPLVRMNCDVGHLFCVGEDPAGVIRSMPAEVAHVHLEDIGKNRVHQHLTPGKGVIDFRAIFEALDAITYTGWVTVELYPYETTAEGVARLAMRHLASLMG